MLQVSVRDQEELERLRAGIAGFQETASQERDAAPAATTTYTAAAAPGSSTADLGSQTDKQTDVRISLLFALLGYGSVAEGGRRTNWSEANSKDV